MIECNKNIDQSHWNKFQSLLNGQHLIVEKIGYREQIERQCWIPGILYVTKIKAIDDEPEIKHRGVRSSISSHTPDFSE